MELNKNEAAIIFAETGDIDLMMPNMDDADVVPAHVLNAVVVMELLSTEDFQKMFTSKFEEMFSKENDSENEEVLGEAA